VPRVRRQGEHVGQRMPPLRNQVTGVDVRAARTESLLGFVLFAVVAGGVALAIGGSTGKVATEPDRISNSEPERSAPATSLDETRTRLLYCVNPEAQYGRYSSYDGGKSAAQILEKKCFHEASTYIKVCKLKHDDKYCFEESLIEAQTSLKFFGK
jgi:hypothetical protein